jgi:flap endonuclease-1
MGIKGLAKLLSDEAPDCIREVPLSSLQGRKIAIDASMAIYQFLIAVRSGGPNQQASMLTNADGETTSHIQGIFNRTIRLIVEGVRPGPTSEDDLE